MGDKELASMIKEALFKEAGLAELALKAKGAIAGAGKAIASDAGKVGGQLQQVGLAAKGKGIHGSNLGGIKGRAKGIASSLGPVVKNKAVQAGAAGTALVGGAGYALANREKQAAFHELIEMGVDFNSAVTLVIEKSAEIYGE